MQSHLPQMHEFFLNLIQCHFVNVSLKQLKIIVAVHHTSVLLPFEHWGKINWSSMSRTSLCRASKLLKLVVLFESTNVLIRWISSLIGGRALHLVPMGAHWVCPPTKWAPMGTKCRTLIGGSSSIHIVSRTLDYWKVHTYQFSAHQRLRFKVRT